MRTGTVSYKLEDLKKGVIIPIGFVGENDFTRVIFDAEEIYKKFPSASVSMKVQPPKGVIYPATVTRDGNTVIWQVKEADVANRGGGELQLTFIDGETKIKTYIAKTDVKRSLAGNGPAPDPIQDFVDNANEKLAEVDDALEDLAAMDNIAKNAQAEDIGKALSPKTVEDGVVTEWEYITPGGGTEDYTDLDNKPSIAGVTLSGNKTLEDLGIAAADDLDNLADDVTDVKTAIDGKPDIDESTATGIDLDVTDENGNVIMRLSGGHIKTKNFDSENAAEIKNSLKTGVDFDLSDPNGNVIFRIVNGQIKTKLFDSSLVNDWFGAVYCSHGDSITWQDGKAYQQGQHIGETARGYQTILKEKLGLASYNNQGKSGWSMAVVNSNGIVNTIKEISDYTQYDLVTIAVGTNDFKLNVAIGTLGVIGDTTFDDTKFFGAYRDAIEYILTNSPKTRIVLMTPLQRDNDGYDVNYTNSAGHKLIDYVEAVEAIGEMYGIPVCDMYGNSGFTKKTLSTYTMDGLHPNDDGYERMGGYLYHFIMNVGK